MISNGQWEIPNLVDAEKNIRFFNGLNLLQTPITRYPFRTESDLEYIKLGYHGVDTLDGDIVDINVWDRILSDEQLKEFSGCGKGYE